MAEEIGLERFLISILKWLSVRDVAQPGSVLAWGARGRKFESCRPDKRGIKKVKKPVNTLFTGFLCVIIFPDFYTATNL